MSSKKSKNKTVKTKVKNLPATTKTKKWSSATTKTNPQTKAWTRYGSNGYTYKTYEPPKVVVPTLEIDDSLKETYIANMIEIFNIQAKSYDQEDMRDFVIKRVEELGCNWETDTAGNLYITKGEAETYPCVVAHLDTVHSFIPSQFYKVLRVDDNLFAIDSRDCSRIGVGGDDQVGIWIALQMLETLPKCKVALFTDEEVGCVGSSSADSKFFDDVSLALQSDRRGYGDFVDNISGTQLFGSSFSKAIAPILDKYNYSETDGGMTDVMQLADNGVEIAMANASSGYYQPHTRSEYVKANESILCFLMFKDIIEEHHLEGYRWEEKREPARQTYSRGWGNYSDEYYGYQGKQYKEAEGFNDPEKTVWNTKKRKWEEPRKDCSKCGSLQVEFDHSQDLSWCYDCQDYDY